VGTGGSVSADFEYDAGLIRYGEAAISEVPAIYYGYY